MKLIFSLIIFSICFFFLNSQSFHLDKQEFLLPQNPANLKTDLSFQNSSSFQTNGRQISQSINNNNDRSNFLKESPKKNISLKLPHKPLIEKKSSYQTLSLLLKNYMKNPDKLKKSGSSLSYSWQFNINYINPLYLRSFVQKLISLKPIVQWPVVIKTLVFPQIYGYYPISFFKPELEKLYKSLVKIKNEEGGFKIDLLEKLIRFEELKKLIESYLLDQTEKMLEGKKYDEKISKLSNYLQDQERKISKVDEMLEEVANY